VEWMPTINQLVRLGRGLGIVPTLALGAANGGIVACFLQHQIMAIKYFRGAGDKVTGGLI
jgi:hypothetical protein